MRICINLRFSSEMFIFSIINCFKFVVAVSLSCVSFIIFAIPPLFIILIVYFSFSRVLWLDWTLFVSTLIGLVGSISNTRVYLVHFRPLCMGHVFFFFLLFNFMHYLWLTSFLLLLLFKWYS